ncbi:MAG: YihY/virulence factor BrkB family protein [Mycobacteriaceae bacterium]|nr:YihY/virulence factor BrkB family protein [Mycobacteriaceae bacterium]
MSTLGNFIRGSLRLTGHTVAKAWDDSIFSRAATAAFWQTLSLPPLLLGLLGSVGYVGGWFGPNTVDVIHRKLITLSEHAFSPNVVDELIVPTLDDVLRRGRADIVSLGFVLSLWAGSSAMSSFVDSITAAHGQADARHPVWQRVFALLLYVMFLGVSVLVLPMVALGPALIIRAFPPRWHDLGVDIVQQFYYPGVGLLLLIGLTTLYQLALHHTLPWHRLLGGALLAGVVFLAASSGLRWYLRVITKTGVSYGALATPIAFLLFTFFLGFAVILGAEFNASLQELHPARGSLVGRGLRRLLRRTPATDPPPTDPDAPVAQSPLRNPS